MAPISPRTSRWDTCLPGNRPANVSLGIADGSKRDILDIVAVNVRTEIAFGLFSDGCTSLFWRTPGRIFLAQNWDVREIIDRTPISSSC